MLKDIIMLQNLGGKVYGQYAMHSRWINNITERIVWHCQQHKCKQNTNSEIKLQTYVRI